MDIHGPKIGLPNVDLDINAPKIGERLDIKGPKIGVPSLYFDINAPKIGGGLDINAPKIGLPGIDVFRGKIGGDIKTPSLDYNGPKLELDINGPKFGVDVPRVGIKGVIEGQPLNIRGILSAGVDAPIVLNKKNLYIPDFQVGVNVPKGKFGLDINGPKIGLPNIDVDINVPKIGGG